LCEAINELHVPRGLEVDGGEAGSMLLWFGGEVGDVVVGEGDGNGVNCVPIVLRGMSKKFCEGCSHTCTADVYERFRAVIESDGTVICEIRLLKSAVGKLVGLAAESQLSSTPAENLHQRACSSHECGGTDPSNETGCRDGAEGVFGGYEPSCKRA
jgi:hypothetical protein